MSVRGIGIDVVAVDRVRKLLDRHGDRALHRLLTDTERAYCLDKAHPAQHVAARIAAKEAAFKALAQDDDALRIGWGELEVARDDHGRPALHLHGRAAKAAARMGVRDSRISLTHERTLAAAIVVLVG
jgi:holo-[acyl-carrier protein] synthase